jgi:hypothetical protein
MNTANLQLEGVYAVLTAFFGVVRDKGVLNGEELDRLLAAVETTLATDPGRPAELRESNVEAICFPARFLRHALQASSQGRAFSFAQIATRVGQMKSDE